LGRRCGLRLRMPWLPLLGSARSPPGGSGRAISWCGFDAIDVPVEETIEKPVAAADKLLRLGGRGGQHYGQKKGERGQKMHQPPFRCRFSLTAGARLNVSSKPRALAGWDARSAPARPAPGKP